MTQQCLLNVFIPRHYSANSCCTSCDVLLDNCSAHRLSDELMNENAFHIYFFPPCITRKFQPADMGNIACIGVGYKITMLGKMLADFDDEHVIEMANQYCKRERARKGWHMDEKQPFLISLEILHGI